MIYKITVKKSAAKEIENLPIKIVPKIARCILGLAENPRPKNSKKLKASSSNLWRIRIGDYRVVYTIDDKIEIVDVQKVGHRKDIYK